MTPRTRPPGSRLDDLTEPDILDVLDGDGESLFLRGQALARELQVHHFAIQELRTKLSVLRDEVSLLDDHNPIEHLSHRVKSPTSIVEKLRRKELPITLDSMRENLDDVAGIRVTCSFISDTYRLHELLDRQPDVTTLQLKDYIAEPKPNGYRGLHAIVETPVHLSAGTRPVRVEVQFRTIAMDFWASLEHKIFYKHDRTIPQALLDELTDAARMANHLDERMETLHRVIRDSGPSHAPTLPGDVVTSLFAGWARQAP